MIVIVVIGTIALISLFAYLGTTALNENIQRSLQERVVLVQTTARHMDYVLADVEHVLTDAASQDLWSDPARNVSVLESTFQQLDFHATQIFLLDARGIALAAHPPITAPVPFTQFAAVAQVLNGQSFAVSRYKRAIDSLGSTTIAVAPVSDTSGRIIGALAVALNLTSSNLQTFTEPIGLGETGYMDLVDLGGTILASTRRERIGSESDHGETLAGMIRDHRAAVSACHDCHAPQPPAAPAREVIAFAPLQRAQWGVTVHQSEDEVFSATRQLQTRIFALMLVMLAGALALVYLTTRSVIAPVQTLTAATKRIAAGDLQTPILSLGRDEIGTLARSFDAMRVHLKDLIEETQKWNQELERRVQESTAAVRSALEDNQRLYAELQQRDRMRGELLHRLITAQEEERKRISRELHDETCQILTGLEYAFDNAAETTTLTELPPLLEQMRAMTETALEGVHRLIFDLRPSVLDHLGLIPALRWYAETRLNGSGTQINIREVGEASRLAPAVETALFRVVQEAINNIARHAGARHANLVFEFADTRVEICIADDGNGFDPATLAGAPDGKRGLGLMGMAERMGVIGGEFHLDSAPGKGTVIHLSAPIPQNGNGKN